jgi:hypothetical protein
MKTIHNIAAASVLALSAIAFSATPGAARTAGSQALRNARRRLRASAPNVTATAFVAMKVSRAGALANTRGASTDIRSQEAYSSGFSVPPAL